MAERIVGWRWLPEDTDHDCYVVGLLTRRDELDLRERAFRDAASLCARCGHTWQGHSRENGCRRCPCKRPGEVD